MEPRKFSMTYDDEVGEVRVVGRYSKNWTTLDETYVNGVYREPWDYEKNGVPSEEQHQFMSRLTFQVFAYVSGL